MQCFFYVLLMLKPRNTRFRALTPQPYIAITPFAVEAVGLALLPYLFHHKLKDAGSLLANVVQTMLIFCPVVLVSIFVSRTASSCTPIRTDKRCKYWFPNSSITHSGSVAKAKRALNSMWFLASAIAVALHLCFLILAYVETDNEKHPYWSLFGLRRPLFWIMR